MPVSKNSVFRCIQNWSFLEHSPTSKPSTILLKSSIIDVWLGSKYTSDCFPKDISLTYYYDLLHLLESENMYLGFQNWNLLWNLKPFMTEAERLMTEADMTFNDGGRYHIETSPLICSANGFYMISASVIKGLNAKVI